MVIVEDGSSVMAIDRSVDVDDLSIAKALEQRAEVCESEARRIDSERGVGTSLAFSNRYVSAALRIAARYLRGEPMILS